MLNTDTNDAGTCSYNYKEWNKILTNYFFNDENKGREVRFFMANGWALAKAVDKYNKNTKWQDNPEQLELLIADFICACCHYCTLKDKIDICGKLENFQYFPDQTVALLCFFSLVWHFELDEGTGNDTAYYQRIPQVISYAYTTLEKKPPEYKKFSTQEFQKYTALWENTKNHFKEWDVVVETIGSDTYVGYPKAHALFSFGEIADLFEEFMAGYEPQDAYEQELKEFFDKSGGGINKVFWSFANGSVGLMGYCPGKEITYWTKNDEGKVISSSISPKTPFFFIPDKDTEKISTGVNSISVPELSAKRINGKTIHIFFKQNARWKLIPNGRKLSRTSLLIAGEFEELSFTSAAGKAEKLTPIYANRELKYKTFELKKGIISQGGMLYADKSSLIECGFNSDEIFVKYAPYSNITAKGYAEIFDFPDRKGREFEVWEDGELKETISINEADYNKKSVSVRTKNNRYKKFLFTVSKEWNDPDYSDQSLFEEGWMKRTCDGFDGEFICPITDIVWAWKKKNGEFCPKEVINDITQCESLYIVPGKAVRFSANDCEIRPSSLMNRYFVGNIRNESPLGKVTLKLNDHTIGEITNVPTVPKVFQSENDRNRLNVYLPDGYEKESCILILAQNGEKFFTSGVNELKESDINGCKCYYLPLVRALNALESITVQLRYSEEDGNTLDFPDTPEAIKFNATEELKYEYQFSRKDFESGFEKRLYCEKYKFRLPFKGTVWGWYNSTEKKFYREEVLPPTDAYGEWELLCWSDDQDIKLFVGEKGKRQGSGFFACQLSEIYENHLNSCDGINQLKKPEVVSKDLLLQKGFEEKNLGKINFIPQCEYLFRSNNVIHIYLPPERDAADYQLIVTAVEAFSLSGSGNKEILHRIPVCKLPFERYYSLVLSTPLAAGTTAYLECKSAEKAGPLELKQPAVIFNSFREFPEKVKALQKDDQKYFEDLMNKIELAATLPFELHRIDEEMVKSVEICYTDDQKNILLEYGRIWHFARNKKLLPLLSELFTETGKFSGLKGKMVQKVNYQVSDLDISITPNLLIHLPPDISRWQGNISVNNVGHKVSLFFDNNTTDKFYFYLQLHSEENFKKFISDLFSRLKPEKEFALDDIVLENMIQHLFAINKDVKKGANLANIAACFIDEFKEAEPQRKSIILTALYIQQKMWCEHFISPFPTFAEEEQVKQFHLRIWDTPEVLKQYAAVLLFMAFLFVWCNNPYYQNR